MKPLISVIIAVYNGAETLENCLESIIQQSYINKELLVIDGGSKDQTLDILSKYSSDISYCVSEDDNGIYDAWNKALLQANGDYIAFLGADDTYAQTGSLESLLELAKKKSHPDFISGRAAMLDADGNLRRTKGGDWQWSKFKRAMGIIVHRGALHHRRLFERYGEFDTQWRIAGDYEFLLRAGPNLQTAFLPEIVVKVGGTGISTRLAISAYKEAFQVQKQSPNIGVFQATTNLAYNLFRYYGGQLKYLF